MGERLGGERGSGAADAGEGIRWGPIRGAISAWTVRPQRRSSGTRRRKTQSANSWTRIAAGCGRHYGLIDPAVRGGVTVPMVHWSVDPRDWESRDTAMVVRSVLKDVQPGDIILLARHLPLLRGGGASDRGRAGGGGVLVCYSGRASGAERHPPKAGLCTVRAGVAQYCRTTATTLPRI